MPDFEIPWLSMRLRQHRGCCALQHDIPKTISSTAATQYHAQAAAAAQQYTVTALLSTTSNLMMQVAGGARRFCQHQGTEKQHAWAAAGHQ
jgi:hypothetical protein